MCFSIVQVVSSEPRAARQNPFLQNRLNPRLQLALYGQTPETALHTALMAINFYNHQQQVSCSRAELHAGSCTCLRDTQLEERHKQKASSESCGRLRR